MKFQLTNFGLILTETYFMASEVLEYSAQLIWTQKDSHTGWK